MNIKKIFSAGAIFLFMACFLFAYSGYTVDEGMREPDSKKRRDDDYVGVIIKTNVEEAEVYINGQLFGTTPVATVDLSATNYTVEIRKDGFDTIRCRIHPKKYYTCTYIFVMEKTCGYLKVRGAPSGAAIYVDGARQSSFPLEVAPGSHSVKVRQFGYEEFYEQVYVENHKTSQVEVSLKVAPFTISQFKISKNEINPNYTSSLGKVNISFYVTNDGTALLLVNDRYGNTVWSRNFNSFSTWEQSVSWDGSGSDGETLPDGTYTIKLISYDYEFSGKIKIDRSLVYPLTTFTPSGSGFGTMPCAFGNSVNYVKLFTQFGTTFNTAAESLVTAVPVSAGLVIDFARHFEIAGSFGADISTDGSETAIKGGGSFKMETGFNLEKGISINLAGFTAYNYNGNKNAPTDYYNGSGLSLGASVALDVEDGYLGFTGEYVPGFTKKDSDGNKTSDIFRYGLAISFLPVTNLRTSMWAAMHNDKYVEAGAEVITMPTSSGFCLDVRAWLVKDLTLADTNNKNMFINAQIGLSYLF